MTILSSFSGSPLQYGLSEVRFTYTPVFPTKPVPVEGDTNVSGQLYVKVNGTKIPYDSLSDVLRRPQWMLWPVDLTTSGADLSSVTSLSIGIDGAAASGVLYVDGTDPGNYRYHGSIDMYYGVVTTEWTHLATVCDGVQTRVYYNGLIAATGTVADTNYGRIAFGLNRASDYPFNGLVDEARLYNRPLSPSEVAALAGITEPIVESF